MQPAIAHVRQAQREIHHLVHLLVVDPELILGQARGNPGVGMCPDVWIDAQAYRRHAAQLARDLVDDLELRGGLHVETRDALLQGITNLRIALAHAGENNTLRREAGRDRSPYFSPAHAIGPEPARSDLRKNARIEIGLDRIVHAVRGITVQLTLHHIQRTPQQRQVVEIERRGNIPEPLYGEIAFQHHSNRPLLKERRARALSSPRTRKEML